MKDSRAPHHGARLDSARRHAVSRAAPVRGHIAAADVAKISSFLPMRLGRSNTPSDREVNDLPNARHRAGIVHARCAVLHPGVRWRQPAEQER